MSVKGGLRHHRPRQKSDIMTCHPLSGRDLPHHPANDTWEGASQGPVLSLRFHASLTGAAHPTLSAALFPAEWLQKCLSAQFPEHSVTRAEMELCFSESSRT